MSEYIEMWKRCFDFSGRSTRKEYWMACLMNTIVIFLLSFLAETGINITGFYGIISILPTFALFIRRLHDINKSGWWWFVCFVPFVGLIIILMFLCTESVDENNNYES